VYSFAGVSNNAVIATSYKYDTSTNTWTLIAPLPGPREQASAVSDGTFIYILGGADNTGANTTTVYRYNPATDTYTTMAPFTVATWAQAAAYLLEGSAGKIYKIAGCGTNCTTFVNSVEKYDIGTDTWSTVAAYPQSVGWLMATGIGNFVYAAGGIGVASIADAYKYDPGTNTWTAVASMPARRWGSAEAIVKTKWMLNGGYVFDGTADVVSNSTVQYDPATNTWAAKDPMPVARSRMSGDSSPATTMYTIGGRDAVVGGFVGTTDNQRFIDLCQGPTVTPTPAGVIQGDLTWEGINHPTPNPRSPLMTGTLTICVGATPNVYGNIHTDTSGNFTVNTGLPDGSYTWVMTGAKNLSTRGTLTLSGGIAVQSFGLQPAGDTNANNIVNATDFGNLRNQFGQAGDRNSDFDMNNVTNATDFNLLKAHFGQSGAAQTCP
jgi:hypothetical protein